MYNKIFKGTAFTSQSSSEVSILKDAIFCINNSGEIEKIYHSSDIEYQNVLENFKDKANFYEIPDNHYFLPGFIDLHIHAPQWAQIGTALDAPLNDWLQTHTFPLESKFSELSFAKKVYEDLVKNLIKNGTTTVMYFATIHEESSFLLAKICNELGQRGLVGKVVADASETNPDYYRDASSEEAIFETETFINKVQLLNQSSIQGIYPVITPRFIPSCSSQVLEKLGDLAKQYNVHVQSHCSESDWEHNYVKNRFNKNDAQVLHDFKLLTEKTVMAHCGHLSDSDASLLSKQGTSIVHCPISNAYFGDGVTSIKRFSQDYDVNIALGTDISGGYSPSIYQNIRQAVMSSRMLESGVDTTKAPQERGVSESRITLQEAFYFATVGGGKALGLNLGKLEEG